MILVRFFKYFFLVLLSVNSFASSYPHFEDNPLLNDRTRFRMAPYLLPLNHPMKAVLDDIFSRSRVLENERTLRDAGFEIIAGPMPNSFVIVVRHSLIPGYVFKLYLDSESAQRKQIPHWEWLVRRCEGARGIRQIIRDQKMRYFSVPDKWLYVLPVYPYPSSLNSQLVILMETDMQLESLEVTEQMWKTVTRKHLDELYCILKQGYGGHGVVNLAANVPFTKQGKFAFTDTEDPRANLNLKYLKKYLSKKMQLYWDTLIQ